MKSDNPHILLVNPLIHDFAAYDFWAKPIGLLYLASILKSHGYSVSYIDCLDRFHKKMPETNPFKRYGRGPYLKTKIPKPSQLSDIPRNYSRYGIMPQWLEEDLYSIQKPDMILITSLMTYWYPGVQETIKIIKTVFPDVPVVLGGIYASLCKKHALLYSGADQVITGQGEKIILDLAKDVTGSGHLNRSTSTSFDPEDINTYPYPAFDMQPIINYIPLMTSKGCPFSCDYCASDFLNPRHIFRSPKNVVEEIVYWNKIHHVKDFVFYDDALLVNAKQHAIPIFEAILRMQANIRFHTPNAIHIREITTQTANLMFKAGLKTLRLGLEVANFESRRDMDSKVTQKEFKRAVICLKNAGFSRDQIGAYLLAGLPGQSITSIQASIKTVIENGITPVIAYYSPILQTRLWDKAKKSSRFDLESDPIFTNNAILPCQKEPFSWKIISDLKNYPCTRPEKG